MTFNNDIEQIFHLACRKLSYTPIPAGQFKGVIKCFHEHQPRPENIELRVGFLVFSLVIIY
jgi:hypothetical protein